MQYKKKTVIKNGSVFFPQDDYLFSGALDID